MEAFSCPELLTTSSEEFIGKITPSSCREQHVGAKTLRMFASFTVFLSKGQGQKKSKLKSLIRVSLTFFQFQHMCFLSQILPSFLVTKKLAMMQSRCRKEGASVSHLGTVIAWGQRAEMKNAAPAH